MFHHLFFVYFKPIRHSWFNYLWKSCFSKYIYIYIEREKERDLWVWVLGRAMRLTNERTKQWVLYKANMHRWRKNSGFTWKWQIVNYNLTHKIIMAIYVILELLKVPRPQVTHIRIQDRVMWAYGFPHYDMANSSVVVFFLFFFSLWISIVFFCQRIFLF